MSTEARVKVGIIGCGNITINGHAPAIRRLGEISAVGVVDPVPQRRQEALTILGLSSEAGYASTEDMLRHAQPDYALVTVPQSLRAPIFEACARLGVHVLTEKPVDTRPAQGQAWADKFREAGLTLGVVHNYLFFPEYVELRRLLAEGAIGEVRHITLNFMGVPDKPGHADYRPQWRHDWRQAGGGILMDMIHVAYLAEFLGRAEIRAVSAVIDNLGYPDGEVEDLALIHLYFDRGYGTISLGWGHGPGGVEVTGSEGRILVFYEDYGTGPFARLQEFSLIRDGVRETYDPRRGQQTDSTFLEVHRNFVVALRSGNPPAAPASAGLRSLAAGLAAYASAVQGRVVALPLAVDDPVYQEGVEGLRYLPARESSPVLSRRLFGLGVKQGDQS